MPTQPLSEAWADLRLSTDKWDSDLRAAQRRLVAIAKQVESTAKVELSATLDTAKTRQQIEVELRRLRATGGITIPIIADVKPAQVAVSEFVTGVNVLEPTVTVDLDTKQAIAQAEALQGSISAFESVIIQVEVRGQQIQQAHEALVRLGTLAATVDNDDIIIDTAVRDAAVKQELVNLKALVEAITGETADIDIGLDAQAVFDTFSKIQATVVALEERQIQLHVGLDETDMARAVTGLAAFNDITIQLDVRREQIDDTRAALQRLAVLISSIDDDRITIDADLREAGIRTELARISQLIVAITNQPANIRLDLDGEIPVLAQLAEVQAAVVALDGRQIDLNIDLAGVAGAVAGIEAIDTAAGNAADERRGGLGRMATMLGFLGIGGVVAIGAAGAAITAFGVQSAAQLQATQKAFENLLGSAEAADKLFKELQAFAVPSPFDTQVLADTTKSLLAIGVTTEEVIPVVKDLGAIVALLGGGSNEAFGRLTLALGQIRSAVKPMTQDLRQITSAIPGFNTEMQLAQGVAEKFGISIAEAQKKIKDGSITGEDAFGIILERMRQFPGVAGSIEASAETLGGKLSAFKDTVKISLIEAFSPVTTQVTDLLVPLQASVEKVLPDIAGSIARSLETIIPRLPGLVESLGTGLAPAFEGIFTGLGAAIEGLTPVIERLLPLIGELAPIFGEAIAALGPAIADTGVVLGAVLVPALQALADVLSIIPTEVLSTLLTAFLAFKAVSGIGGILGTLNTRLLEFNKTTDSFGTVTQKTGGLSKAVSGLQQTMQVAGPAIAGAFAGIGLAAEDATTRGISAVSAIAAIATGFVLGPVAGAITVATVGLGVLLGKMQEGKREAKEFEDSVKQLANVIEAELGPDQMDIDLAGAIGLEAVRKQVQALIEERGLTGGVLASGLGLADINTHLKDSKEEFEAWLLTVVRVKIEAGDFEFGVKLLNGELAFTDVNLGKDQEQLETFGPALFGLEKIYNELEGSITAVNEGLELQASLYPDAADAANLFEERVAGVSGQIDHQTAALAAQREALLALQHLDVPGVNGPIEAANLFEARVAGLADAEEYAAKKAKELDDAFEEAFGNANAAVDELTESLREMQGLLSADFADQNFRKSMQDFAEAINQVTNQDQIDEGLRLEEQVADQRQDIIDQQSRIIDAQRDADLEAADLQDQIDIAFRTGSVNRAAELQKRLGRVNEDANEERDKLRVMIDELRALEQELAGIDLNPRKLLDTVKAQAGEEGLSIADFLRFGTTDEVIQAQQEIVGPLIDGALSAIEREVEFRGPQAGLDLAHQLEAGLVGTLTPAFGADAAQQIVDTYLPPDTWFAAGEEAAKQAREAAIAEFAATGEIPLTANLDPSTEKTLATLEFLRNGGVIPAGVTLSDVQQTLDEVALMSPEIKAQLGLGPLGMQEVEDQIDDFKRDRQHGDQFVLTLDVDADTTAANKAIEDVGSPQILLVPDMSAIEIALTVLEGRPVRMTIVPEIVPPDIPTQSAIPNYVFPVPRTTNPTGDRVARHGGIFEMGSHFTSSERVMPFETVRYGEPATHGEAVFVPMHSDRARTERLLRHVAEKLSFTLTPRDGTVNVAAPNVAAPNVFVQVMPTPSIERYDTVTERLRSSVLTLLHDHSERTRDSDSERLRSTVLTLLHDHTDRLRDTIVDRLRSSVVTFGHSERTRDIERLRDTVADRLRSTVMTFVHDHTERTMRSVLVDRPGLGPSTASVVDRERLVTILGGERERVMTSTILGGERERVMTTPILIPDRDVRVAVPAPQVHVSVPSASAPPTVDVATVVREMVQAMRTVQRAPLTQAEYDRRGVHVDKIEHLVIGDGASACRRAFQFLDELKQMKL